MEILTSKPLVTFSTGPKKEAERRTLSQSFLPDALPCAPFSLEADRRRSRPARHTCTFWWSIPRYGVRRTRVPWHPIHLQPRRIIMHACHGAACMQEYGCKDHSCTKIYVVLEYHGFSRKPMLVRTKFSTCRTKFSRSTTKFYP